MPQSLKILFVTPECAPWVKTGGLGDVSAALPRALAEHGHDVKLLMPAYPGLRQLARDAEILGARPGDGPFPPARLLGAGRHGGVELLLLDCPGYYDRPGGPYDDSGGDNALRFGLLSRVAAELGCDTSPWPHWRPELLHCNDWPTGLAPAWLRVLPGRTARSVMTIHNLAFQGLFPLGRAHELGLPGDWLGPHAVEYWGQISFLKAGINFSDAVTAVSPTYAREIQQETHGCGFDGILRDRAGRLCGILNGIDTSVWDPADDPHLAQGYDAGRLDAKAVNKTALQRRLGLAEAAHAPLFGLVSRLTEQKGIDLVLEVLPWLLSQGAQLAVLGQGDPVLEQRLQEAAAAQPRQVAVQIGFDEALAHQIEAGSDAYLMPSRFEPCGLNQMYSQAYGTPPVVRATGGLADTVVDQSAAPARGTGFCFREPSAPAFQACLERVLDAWHEPAGWRMLQQRCMAQPLDWRDRAQQYVDVYRELLATN
ncbi:glycogen synthase GlgA [Aquabacterium sp. A7-Y]|uniref:glycogen synthase GlgA n=1 Tax=Aquabacterium sp. A7-Y TaxID=1349605 RepID=UPI00223CA10F|nr:glycogen synthase GlgA [Aquabacterium sp. A7-Y]MCW7540611.1 glycogen synthase GlgA [Aquabacterium sp. A7-Y]